MGANAYRVPAETPQANEITTGCPMAFSRHLCRGGLCVRSPLCHTGSNSAKQLVITSNILIDSSEVNETKLHTLFTSFAEPK